jgi:hypothetical protein
MDVWGMVATGDERGKGDERPNIVVPRQQSAFLRLLERINGGNSTLLDYPLFLENLKNR